MGTAASMMLCSSNSNAVSQPLPPPQSLYCHHCRGVISSGPSAFLAGQGRFGLNAAGQAECPRCRGSFIEVLTELERRRIQIASPLRQVRVAATNIMPGRRVTANDIVYTFFLFDTDIHRHVADLVRDSDLEAAISQSLDEAASSPQKATAKRINDVVSSFLESIRKEDSHVSNFEIEKQGCCPVCDEKLHDNESILRLPCEHVFHHDCLMPWLGTHNTCPICRIELPVEEDKDETKSSTYPATNLTPRSLVESLNGGDQLQTRASSSHSSRPGFVHRILSDSERLPSPRTLAARVQRGAPAALVTNNGGSQIVYDASIVELPRSIVHPTYGDTHATDSSPATPRPGLASDAASASPGRGGSTTGADGGQGEGAGPHAEVEADRAPPGRAANEASSRAPDAGDVVSDGVHDADNSNATATLIGSGGDTEREDADKQLPGMQEGTGSLYVSQGGAEEAEARLVSGDELQAPVLPGAALVAAA